MSRKKTNPGRIPSAISEEEAKRLIENEVDRMILYAWALVLGAMADRPDTTAESLMDFCETVSDGSGRLQSRRDVSPCLSALEELTGLKFPFHTLIVTGIRTKRDVERLRRKADENSIHSMFALIADAALVRGLITKEYAGSLFRKVHVLDEELSEGRISLQDLLGVLEEEFGLLLVAKGAGISLHYTA